MFRCFVSTMLLIASMAIPSIADEYVPTDEEAAAHSRILAANYGCENVLKNQHEIAELAARAGYPEIYKNNVLGNEESDTEVKLLLLRYVDFVFSNGPVAYDPINCMAFVYTTLGPAYWGGAIEVGRQKFLEVEFEVREEYAATILATDNNICARLADLNYFQCPR